MDGKFTIKLSYTSFIKFVLLIYRYEFNKMKTHMPPFPAGELSEWSRRRGNKCIWPWTPTPSMIPGRKFSLIRQTFFRGKKFRVNVQQQCFKIIDRSDDEHMVCLVYKAPCDILLKGLLDAYTFFFIYKRIEKKPWRYICMYLSPRARKSRVTVFEYPEWEGRFGE